MATKIDKPIVQFLYAWEGKDRAGKVVKGELRSSGDSAVAVTLRRQGILVTKVKKVTHRSAKKITEKDLTVFTRQLATMIKSGVPLLQSFDIVAKGHANPSVGRLLNDIRNDVETGTSLSNSFRKYPLYFDNLFCNLIAAGEQAGILDQLRDRLASYKEKTQSTKKKVKSALMYPTAVFIVALIVPSVIMIFVVPAFKKIFASFGADLPAPTLIVMAMSDFFVEYWYLIFGGLAAGLYFLMQSFRRSPAMQALADRLSLRVPIFGEIIRKSIIARWARTLSTMFAAGVPLVEALDSVGGAAGNIVYATATRAIQKEVSSGTSLTIAMQRADVFPAMVTQMTEIGEESGTLDTMLSRVADYFENEVDDAVKSLSSLMEPIIMVVLGVIIGGLIIAMYLPIFKLGSVIG